MADKTSDPSSAASNRATTAEPDRADEATLQAYGFDRMTDMGTAWLDTLNQMGGEVTSFVADRIREDLKTQHRLLHCKDIRELQEIQAEFIQTAIRQYQAESGRLVEMSRKMLSTDRNDESS